MAGFFGEFSVHWKCLDVKKYNEDSETGYISVTARSEEDARDKFIEANPKGYKVLDVSGKSGKKVYIRESMFDTHRGYGSLIFERNSIKSIYDDIQNIEDICNELKDKMYRLKSWSKIDKLTEEDAEVIKNIESSVDKAFSDYMELFRRISKR